MTDPDAREMTTDDAARIAAECPHIAAEKKLGEPLHCSRCDPATRECTEDCASRRCGYVYHSTSVNEENRSWECDRSVHWHTGWDHAFKPQPCDCAHKAWLEETE